MHQTRGASLALLVVAVAGCQAAPPSATPAPQSAPPPPTATFAAPTASPSPAPTSLPTAEATVTGEVSWLRIATVDGYPDGIVGFDDGYILLSGGVAYTSADGLAWKQHELPIERGSASSWAIGSDGHRVVVVGGVSPCERDAFWTEWGDWIVGCRPFPVSWVTDDGRTWRRGPTIRSNVTSEDAGGSILHAVWALPGGGWEAMQSFWGGDLEEDPDLERPTIWRSPDGLHWSIVGAFPGEPRASDDWYYAEDVPTVAIDREGRRVATWYREGIDDPMCSVLESRDGSRYEPIAGVGCGTGIPWADGSRWFLPAAEFSGGESGPRTSSPLLMTSDDLAHWSSTPLSQPAGVSNAVPVLLGLGAGRYVMVGEASAGGRVEATMTWVSDDGRRWRIADVSAELGWQPRLASGPHGTLLIGSVPVAEDASAVAVWRLTESELGYGG